MCVTVMVEICYSLVIYDRTRGSAVLWRIYIEFEVQAEQLERAKKMLYRAIGECPLSKGESVLRCTMTDNDMEAELYLMAFGPLRSVFTTQELDTFLDAMVERQLRMRTSVDELLEGQKDTRREDSEDSTTGMDEIEHNANELRRLRPY